MRLRGARATFQIAGWVATAIGRQAREELRWWRDAHRAAGELRQLGRARDLEQRMRERE